MRDLMRSTRQTFRGSEREWRAFVEQIDKSVEAALFTTAKSSLEELSRSINGDGTTEVQPLFGLQVALKRKIEFAPSIADLTQAVNANCKNALATISSVPRLTEALSDEEDSSSPSFYALVT